MNFFDKKLNMLGLMFICFMTLLLGCHGQTNSMDNNESENNGNMYDNKEENVESLGNSSKPWDYDGEPVTLTFRIGVDEETFQARYKDVIEEKFPNIKLELLSMGYGEEAMQELFVEGVMPDIHMGKPVDYLVDKLDYLEPIDEYVERSGFDLSVFQEGIIESMRKIDPMGEGHLYGLPVENSVLALYYNKDIFDSFGEPYPKDGITWTETLEIAKRLTQERNGVQYRGLQIDPADIPFTQLSVQGTDPKTGEILFVDNPDTRRYFEFLDEYRNIPEIMVEDNEAEGFQKGSNNIAMVIRNTPWLEVLVRNESFNFDMTTVPTWEDLPNIAPTWGALSLSIPKHSKNKEASWSVVSYLASEEGQIHLSQAGSPPVIDSPKAFEDFTINSIKDSDKEYNSIVPFEQKLAPLPKYSKYDEQFTGYIQTKGKEFLTSEKDVVTFLREMGEEYKSIVREIKGQE